MRVFHTAFDYVIFRQLTASDKPTLYLNANRQLGFVRTGKVDTLTAERLNEFEWAHVAVVYDSTASQVRLYLNGTRVQTVSGVTAPLGGASTTDGESVADGLDMDEFRLWNVARSDSQILANAFDPIADQAGLVCYLKFEEGSGSALVDSHSGGPGATQTGCVWMWPERMWASPSLERLPRTHGLWWDEFGGMASEVRIDILDPSGTDPISIGTLLLSNGWRPERNVSEGSSPFGVQDFGSRETAPNGVTHVTRGAPIDIRTLLFLSTSHDEMYQLWHRLAFGVSNSIPADVLQRPDGPAVPLPAHDLWRVRWADHSNRDPWPRLSAAHGNPSDVLMAFRLPNNVLQLSTTSGTGAYSFTGVVSGYAAFSTQLANGDTVPYFARDAASWEVGLGTWASAGSTLSRTLIASSSGGLISWPGTGSREVGCGLPGTWLLQLLDPSAAAGFVTRGTTLGTWAMRTFANGSFISVDHPAGTAGNPTINDAALATTYFPRKDTGSSTINAIWTFAQRLIFGGFSGTPSVQELRGQSDELMWRWRRDAANDYDAEVRQAASWRRVLTATAADLNDADLLRGFDPNDGRQLQLRAPLGMP